MKVLVTGSSGLIGSWLGDALSKEGHEVVGVDLRASTVASEWPTHCHDILDLNAMTWACGGCDAVYHCAAMAYEGLSVFSPRCITENVVVGTVTVAAAAIRCGVKKFINMSSMARYGNKRFPWPFAESDEPRPVDPYGAAKLAAEKQLDILGETHGMKVIHAVPHNVSGARQNFQDPYRNVIAIMANRMLQGKPAIIYGDGEQKRCFSDIRDVLPVLLKILACDAKHGEVFNVGPDSDPVTINTVERLVSEFVGVDLPPIHVEARPREVRSAWCISDKIRERFAFEQRYSLRDTVASVVEWVRSRGPKPFVYDVPLEIESDLTPKTWRERLI